MPMCEKCWERSCGVADKYHELILKHNCTPEEQAGQEATECPTCGRKTIHPYAKVCTACGREGMDKPWIPNNGDDGLGLEQYCSECARDSKHRETGQGEFGCPIVAAAYYYDYDSRFFPHQYLSIRQRDGSLVCEMFVMEDKE